jgi:2'-5' RNA ligase
MKDEKSRPVAFRPFILHPPSILTPMRLFVAIPLPPVAQAGVRHLADKYEAVFPGFRWVNPGLLHVTLKFLGEVDDLTAAGAKKALGSVSPGAPLMLRFGTARLLGPTKGVLALDLAGDVEQLVELQAKVEGAFARLGFAMESRGFLPHVTVARSNDQGFKGRSPAIEPPKPWFNVTAVSLMQSKLGGAEPMYESLLNVPMLDPLEL